MSRTTLHDLSDKREPPDKGCHVQRVIQNLPTNTLQPPTSLTSQPQEQQPPSPPQRPHPSKPPYRPHVAESQNPTPQPHIHLLFQRGALLQEQDLARVELRHVFDDIEMANIVTPAFAAGLVGAARLEAGLVGLDVFGGRDEGAAEPAVASGGLPGRVGWRRVVEVDVEEELVVAFRVALVELLADLAVGGAYVVGDDVLQDAVHVEHLAEFDSAEVVEEQGAFVHDVRQVAGRADVLASVEGSAEEPDAVDGSSERVALGRSQESACRVIVLPLLKRVHIFPLLCDLADSPDIFQQGIAHGNISLRISGLGQDAELLLLIDVVEVMTGSERRGLFVDVLLPELFYNRRPIAPFWMIGR
ncbi:hypothetical protein KC328_g88 [Hortaea werneckii]|nr:hypothetical protein KC328_g88 [Hortaea werneckii]